MFRYALAVIAAVAGFIGTHPAQPAGLGPDVVQGPPPGWELVKITDDPDQDQYGHMNNRGQIVFTKRILPNTNGTMEEVFLYENGKVRRLTFDDTLEEGPKLNDDGTIVWQRRSLDDDWEIVRYQDGVIEQLTDNDVADFKPAVGNSGLILWSRQQPNHAASLIEYRDGVATEIVSNGLNNQCIEINAGEDFSWVRYDFDAEPWWTSTIMCSIGGEIHELTEDETLFAQGCAITDDRVVGWNDEEGVKLWEDGIITVIPGTEDDSTGPVLNNVGDIRYSFWVGEYWGAFLIRDGITYQLNDSPSLGMGGGDINDAGEVSLVLGDFPETDIWLMWRMRAPGDFTGDGSVDRFDLESYQNCLSNEGCGTQTPPACFRVFDFDQDGDLDFHDFGAFQRAVTPP